MVGLVIGMELSGVVLVMGCNLVMDNWCVVMGGSYFEAVMVDRIKIEFISCENVIMLVLVHSGRLRSQVKCLFVVRSTIFVCLGPVVPRESGLLVCLDSVNGIIVSFEGAVHVGRSGCFVVRCVLSVQDSVKAWTLMAVVHFSDMSLQRLHLDDHVAARCVHIRGVENAAVGLKSTTGLVPAA